MKNNILILSAGRRVELVQAFQKELNQIFPEALVYCTDMFPELSAACQVSNGCFKVPRVTDPDYLDVLERIFLENNVGLVIPTIDTELSLLASSREYFLSLGVVVVISSTNFTAACRDKRETSKLFSRYNIDQPKIYKLDSLRFPCFCKPFDGSCSIGAFVINNESELSETIINNEKNMYMELIPKSFNEYTVDCYFTNDGNLVCLVPRKRLEVRSGEVSKGVTKKNFVYDYLLDKLKYIDGARGCITFQFFVDESKYCIKGLEVNPRFGGGYPLSYDAGANYPRWLIKEYLLNEAPSFYESWESDLIMLRYDAKVLTREVR